MGHDQIRITETPNELTNALDEVDAVGIVRLLRQTDTQLFSGWRHYPALLDAEFSGPGGPLEVLTSVAFRLLTPKDGTSGGDTSVRNCAIVFSGCGTSGRIGGHSKTIFCPFLIIHR